MSTVIDSQLSMITNRNKTLYQARISSLGYRWLTHHVFKLQCILQEGSPFYALALYLISNLQYSLYCKHAVAQCFLFFSFP